MRHFFDMTGNGQPAKRRLRAALSEKLWDMCVCVCVVLGAVRSHAQENTSGKQENFLVLRQRTNFQQNTGEN
jgi:hypothetical protein